MSESDYLRGSGRVAHAAYRSSSILIEGALKDFGIADQLLRATPLWIVTIRNIAVFNGTFPVIV